ncbi:MAG: RES domain-containing protein [Cyanobium sp.]
MVRIDPPPPRRSVQPVFHTLPAETRLLRIYDPGEWNNTAHTFRRTGGPRLRFDHHLGHEGQSRGIHYSALTLEGCVVEVFGDDGMICAGSRRLGSLLLKRNLRLLDLRGEGAWRAGATAAICSSTLHSESQPWARYFYESDAYLDGLLYPNAHNAADAVALFERAEEALLAEHDLPLADPRLRPRLLAAVEALHLIAME